MPVIKKKNFLNLGPTEQLRWWDDIRGKPELDARLGVGTLIGMIPGAGEIGRLASSFLRGSVGVHGIVVFLIGDDPLDHPL